MDPRPKYNPLGIHEHTFPLQQVEKNVQTFEAGTFKKYDLNHTLTALEKIAKKYSIDRETNAEYRDTVTMLTNAFDLYTGKTTVEDVFGIDSNQIRYGFVVPPRGEDPEEADTVIPVFKKIFEQSNDIGEARADMQTIMNLAPPLILAKYEHDVDGPVGLLVYTPTPLEELNELYQISSHEPIASLMADYYANPKYLRDLWAYFLPKYSELKKFNARFGEVQNQIVNSVNETIAFLKRIAPNTEHIGLGAILPALTELGGNVDSRIGIDVTTGHRMTLIGMQKTLEAVLQVDERDVKDKFNVGVIGSGYIGKSIASLTLDKFPNATVTITDAREKVQQDVYEELDKKYPGRVRMDTTSSILANNKYIYSAITSKIELSEEDQANLEGTIIIDDSEPSGFDPAQLELLGAIPLKPLFDLSNTGMSRTGVSYLNGEDVEYNYGSVSGLNGSSTFFGCEAEAYAAHLISLIPGAFPEVKVQGQKITADMIQALGELPANMGILVLQEMLQGQGKIRFEEIQQSKKHRSKSPLAT